MNQIVYASDVGLMRCGTCGCVVPRRPVSESQRCLRCGRLVDRAGEASAQATWAWLLAAVTLYIPANALPVMHTSGLAGDQDSTIIAGIIAFWQEGSLGIAAIIFVASILVPLTKFCAIGLLLWSVKYRRAWHPHQRSRLYRAVEFIGYWSMLDVAVVAITATLMQFNAIGAVDAKGGIACFCAVVILTMLSARSFSPRLIWAGNHRPVTHES